MSRSASGVAIAVVGGGAAGLMAAIQAARAVRSSGGTPSVAVLDGAARLGAKILISGGGRCNVTHVAVSERDFAGSTPAAIRKIVGRFGVPRTTRFFEEIGVRLLTEPTGKLFPAGNRSRVVLDALIGAATDSGVRLLHPRRVDAVRAAGGAFEIAGAWGEIRAGKLILATGGMSVPRTGSDGHGFALARSLGHGTTPKIVPALVPLVLADGFALRGIPGVSAEAVLTVRSGTGRRLVEIRGPVLCTHFGISGPAVLDVSRHWILARADDPDATLVANWFPGESESSIDANLLAPRGGSASGFLSRRIPARLADALCRVAAIDPREPGRRLTRDGRRRLARAATAMTLPVIRDRGFAYAEATAGGVPLSEVRLDSMESRVCPGLHLCGEILDVDGRIGGFNFQWAWSSGYVAGVAAAA